MGEVSRFGGGFAAALVKPGTKVLDSTRAELTAVSTKDKFTLNPLAKKMLGIDRGSRIALFDDRMSKNSLATGMNDRFFIVPNYKNATGQIIGSKIGKGLSFSYAGVWSAMHMADMDITGAKPEDMAAAGKAFVKTYQMTDKEGNLQFNENGEPIMTENCIAYQRVTFEVRPALNEEGVNAHYFHVDPETGQPLNIVNEVYELINMEVVKHDPRTEGASNVEAADDDDDDDAPELSEDNAFVAEDQDF